MDINFYETKWAKKITQKYGLFCKKEHPKFIQNSLNWLFKKITGIKTKKKKKYPSINRLFTRDPETRKIDPSDNTLISPVDGKITSSGQIKETTLFQAKGNTYSIKSLIGNEFENIFNDGIFITFYLSPKDCHQIFAPITGQIESWIHHPGHLYPVREPYISNQSQLYSKNERLTTILNSKIGKIAIVKVAAIGVGNMTLTYDNSINTNQGLNQNPKTKKFPTPTLIQKGSHLATFNLGSTVILLFEKNKIKLNHFSLNTVIKYADPIGKALTPI